MTSPAKGTVLHQGGECRASANVQDRQTPQGVEDAEEKKVNNPSSLHKDQDREEP